MNVKRFLLCMGCILMAAIAGCIKSLHPLFTEKEAVFLEELVGQWLDDNGQSWDFKRYSPNESDVRYKLVYTDPDGKKGYFRVVLGELDSMLFMDLYPEEPKLDASDFYQMHLLGVHSFIKIEQIQPTLKMRMIDPDKLQQMFKNDPNILKHEILEESDSEIVLTASTKELQDFMIQYGNDPNLFGDVGEFERLLPPDANEPNSIDPNKIETSN
ncbi:MAG: hypothetical protein JXB29_04845 [Sedimentisphaerales bacterium]|nr:hypothetical protein [Sedimentisphaerales bacterium]